MFTVSLAQQFKLYLLARKSPRTAHGYSYWVGRFFSEGYSETLDDAHAFILSLGGKARNTVSAATNAIEQFFEWRGSPIELDVPWISRVQRTDPEYVTLKQVEEILSECRSPLEATLVTILFDSGCRISEVLGLNASDVDYENGLITVTRKRGARESVNVTDRAVLALRSWLGGRKSGKVFGGLRYYTAWAVVKDLGKRAGVRLHPHMFRHARAIHMLQSGATLYDVQQHLGHRNLTVTADIYSRFKALDLKQRIPGW